MENSKRLLALQISSRYRYRAAWLLAVLVASLYLYFSWHHFDDPDRLDGNRGHTYVDFGGQYLLGRMLVNGQGQHLFNRSVQREVLHKAYPRENENPGQETGDVEMLMLWFVGPDESAAEPGGPLYPPILAYWFSPLAVLPPQVAYRTLQILIVLGAFGAGLGLSFISDGRLWWPVASIFVIVFPGFAGSLGLGQNSIFSLLILIGGWVLIQKDRPGWGGLVWGLLAFKPIWAAAFFLVPIWAGRWRVCLAMLSSGLMQFVLTLPLVGWHGWTDWLRVGAEAIRLSTFEENWITRGRDLIALPRRWMDFNAPSAQLQNNLVITLIGWGLWLMVLEITSRVAVFHGLSKNGGAGAAFLFFGAWLCCVHFMYYDVLLAALPVFLLYQGQRWPHWSCHVLVGILFLAPAITESGLGEPALETFCILGLWIVSGWAWIRGNESTSSESVLGISRGET